MSETISNTTLTKCECGKWVNYADDPHHIARVRQIADLQREVGLLYEAIDKIQQLHVGQYWVAPHPMGGHWIEIDEGVGKGEGMQTEKLAELIDKFYTENFS